MISLALLSVAAAAPQFLGGGFNNGFNGGGFGPGVVGLRPVGGFGGLGGLGGFGGFGKYKLNYSVVFLYIIVLHNYNFDIFFLYNCFIHKTRWQWNWCWCWNSLC